MHCKNVQNKRKAEEIPETDRAWITRGRRQIRKMKEKATWFQKEKKTYMDVTETKETSWRHRETDRGKPPPTTVLYIPATPEGTLAKRLQEADLKFSELHGLGWTKIIERGGTKIKDIVTNKYPWAEVSSQREDCLLCRSSLHQPPELPPAYRS